MIWGDAGKRRFAMPLIPSDLLGSFRRLNILQAVRDGGYALYVVAREDESGRWVVGVDGARPGTEAFDRLAELGEVENAGNGYIRTKLPSDLSETGLLREAARRLTAALDGQTPDISFVRATGANPGRPLLLHKNISVVSYHRRRLGFDCL